MKLEVISPENILFSGEVVLVTLPGISGSFTVLSGHAPIISSLKKGKLIWQEANCEKTEWMIKGGFIEMKNNIVSVCIDGIVTDIWQKTGEYWVQ